VAETLARKHPDVARRDLISDVQDLLPNGNVLSSWPD
jgi:hypothetical protein